ncbi:MAG: type II toxin-antitoxin system PemK/MazF family toxin [Xanthomonadales bacterium]|nr:type II toxin-antitoxin system PemK/MazF family toxin [Xanthomonadales bacterium]
MVTFAVGNVVVVPFPFSDLSQNKKRPALVLANVGHNDWVCLQITSKPYADQAAICLLEHDFAQGSLQRQSFIRPGKIFTAHESLFLCSVGSLRDEKFREVRQAVIRLIEQGALR